MAVKEYNPYYLKDHYTHEYENITKSVKQTNKNKIRKQVADILKKNTIQNIEQLNEDIFHIIQMDDAFAQQLLR